MAGEPEVGLKTAESAPSFTNTTFKTDQYKASPPPKKKKVGGENVSDAKQKQDGMQVGLMHDLYLLVATYKKWTLKVNCIPSSTQIRMLSDFIYKQELDVILLQEVAHTDFDRIRGLRERELWQMNRKLLEDTTAIIRFQQERTRWWPQKKNFPDVVSWWEKCVKRSILFLLIQEGTVKNRDNMIQENVNCACI